MDSNRQPGPDRQHGGEHSHVHPVDLPLDLVRDSPVVGKVFGGPVVFGWV